MLATIAASNARMTFQANPAFNRRRDSAADKADNRR